MALSGRSSNATASAVAGQVDPSLNPEANMSRTPLATFDSISQVPVTQHFQLNNTALKWFRDLHERPKGFPSCDEVCLTNTDPAMIGVLVRDKGTAYHFSGAMQPWSWRQMFASFREDVRRQILGHSEQHGLEQISCSVMRGSYDHKRQHSARAEGAPFPQDAPTQIWDFVVRRTDGHVIRFHPQQTSKKVEISRICHLEASYPMDPPKAGKGMSDGPGTFSRFKSAAYSAPNFADTSAVVEPRKAVSAVAEPRKAVQFNADDVAVPKPSDVGPPPQKIITVDRSGAQGSSSSSSRGGGEVFSGGAPRPLQQKVESARQSSAQGSSGSISCGGQGVGKHHGFQGSSSSSNRGGGEAFARIESPPQHHTSTQHSGAQGSSSSSSRGGGTAAIASSAPNTGLLWAQFSNNSVAAASTRSVTWGASVQHDSGQGWPKQEAAPSEGGWQRREDWHTQQGGGESWRDGWWQTRTWDNNGWETNSWRTWQ